MHSQSNLVFRGLGLLFLFKILSLACAYPDSGLYTRGNTSTTASPLGDGRSFEDRIIEGSRLFLDDYPQGNLESVWGFFAEDSGRPVRRNFDVAEIELDFLVDHYLYVFTTKGNQGDHWSLKPYKLKPAMELRFKVHDITLSLDRALSLVWRERPGVLWTAFTITKASPSPPAGVAVNEIYYQFVLDSGEESPEFNCYVGDAGRVVSCDPQPNLSWINETSTPATS